VAYVDGARKKSFTEPSEVQLSKLVFYLDSQLRPAVKDVTKLAELNTLIQTVPGVVLSFWAPWCGPTKKFKPIYEELAKECQSDMITFLSINTDDS
jgi:thiol-disulfide isomerase/thioredoxin